MDMRLNHTSIVCDSPCGACRSQFVVEGDVMLPGSLRETTHVLHASAMAVPERTEAMQDRISVSGRTVFCVLYTQGEKTEVESIEASADFNHLCDLPGATSRADVDAFLQVEQVDARVQSGRMTMRAVIRMCASAVNTEEAEVISAVDADGAQLRTAKVKTRRRVGRGDGEVLLREEFPLPAELAVQDTLCAFATAEFHDTAGGQGRVGLAGEVTIEAVHASAIPGKPLVTTRHTVPVSQSVELRGEGDELLDGRIVVKDVAVASQDIGDGERTLRAEVLLGLSAWADREEEHTLLSDAYTTAGEDLRLTYAPMQMRTGVNRMSAAESGKTSLLLPEGTPPIRTMLAAFAQPVLTATTTQGSRTVAEGTLNTTLLYMTDGQAAPVSAQVETPFRMPFAVQAGEGDIVLLTAASVEAVPITSDRAELRYILRAQVEGNAASEVSLVTDAAAIPAMQTTRDIVLCYPQPGETAWDIAKRYRIPESELRALNPDLPGEPEPGRGIVVWRRKVV